MLVVTPQERHTRFFELHARDQLFVMPNPWDVGSAPRSEMETCYGSVSYGGL